MFIRECAGDWHLWKGGGGSRKRHRKRMSCDAGWTTSAKPTGSSEAEMMAHWRCSKLGRNRQAFTSPDPLVSGYGSSSEGGEAALRSWANKSFLEGGSGNRISVSIQDEYLITRRTMQLLIFFFITNRKGKDFCIHDKIREFFAKISTAGAIETTRTICYQCHIQ